MLPRIKLTDLLMDVAHITGFHEQFTHASNNRKPDKEETVIIMAALLGMGLNIGLSKMAEATPDLTYKQLANVSQWRMHEDAMSKAQAVLVNFHDKLDLSSYWGDGTTSSSDGMRMQVAFHLYIQTQIRITEPEKVQQSTDLPATSSHRIIQKLFILIQDMLFMS